MRRCTPFISRVPLSRSLTTGLLLTLLVILGPATAHAAPGDLDPTFGAGGKVTTDFISAYDWTFALVLQPDGKLVAAGEACPAGCDFALARYNADGSLDPTFGAGGTVTTDFGSNDGASALVLQPDGKLVAAGKSAGNFALARYNADGSLDPTFGTGGMVTTDFGGLFGDEAYALVLQPDGKLVAAGTSCLTDDCSFALARYNADGSLDPTFGAGGTVTTDFGSESDRAYALVLQPDGKLVAAGVAFSCPTFSCVREFTLARYNADGSLDPTFGTGGTVTTDFGVSDGAAYALVLQPDGKLVVAGESAGNFALARYNADGSLDPTFGTGGMVTTGFGGFLDSANAFALVIQPDGKLVAAGDASVGGSGGDFALARYNADGSLDTTFGTGDMVTTDFGGDDWPRALVLQPDGKLVAAGQSCPFGCDFALARYEGTPFPDLTGTWNSLSQTCRTIRGTPRCRLMGQVNVTNQGNVKLRRASLLRFFLSSDGITPETLLRQVAVGALRAGQTQGKRLSAPLPIGTTATGKFVIAVIDATNTVVETNKTNNAIVFGPLP